MLNETFSVIFKHRVKAKKFKSESGQIQHTKKLDFASCNFNDAKDNNSFALRSSLIIVLDKIRFFFAHTNQHSRQEASRRVRFHAVSHTRTSLESPPLRHPHAIYSVINFQKVNKRLTIVTRSGQVVLLFTSLQPPLLKNILLGLLSSHI